MGQATRVRGDPAMGPGGGVLSHMPSSLRCSPHLHNPCSSSFSFLLWLGFLGGCSISCQHPGEAAEPLCLPAACSWAREGEPCCLVQMPLLQGCSQPAAAAAPEGVSQGAQHTIHIATGGVAAHEANAQDLGGEGQASPCSTHLCSRAPVPSPCEQSSWQQSAGSRAEQGVCEEQPCMRTGLSACAQCPACSCIMHFL